MKLIFAGTPAFAAEALRALAKAGHEIVLVLSQPDRPAGRGMKLKPGAVSAAAAALGLPVYQPVSLKDPEAQARIAAAQADVMVVAAYGLLLPQAVLDMPRLGCINIHGSLLPRWRGAAPVQRAIEAGDRETGIAIMQMDAGLDTGPVLLEKRMPIAGDETSRSLFDKLTALGAAAIVEALEKLPKLVARPQPAEGVSYARKIEKAEARIDWSQPASQIERRIRAFDPFPGCETEVHGEPVKLWRASVAEQPQNTAEPGTVVAADGTHVAVQCGRDWLQWEIVQKPGGRRMSIAEFLRGTSIEKGIRL